MRAPPRRLVAPLALLAAMIPLALGTLAAIALPTASTACTTSGDIDAGRSRGTEVLPDGAPFVPNEGGVNACVFDELDTFSCPGIALAPSPWAGKCVDGDDCTQRVNGTIAKAGCQETTLYQNVQVLATTCAAWEQGGGTIPVATPTPDAAPTPVCAPGSVASFTPTWHPPKAKVTSCTAAQIDGYLQCLIDEATTLAPSSCAEWRSSPLSAADQTCVSCLTSNETDPTYGPFVALPTELLSNVAGCIALAEGKTDGSGCGGKLQADEQCQQAACLPSCATGSSTEISAEQACEAQANVLPSDAGAGGVCATFVLPATCAGAIEEGDAGTAPEGQCFGAPDAGAIGQLEGVALAFCGP